MLQLFNDQRRSVSGPGGHAMLWLKTLRDFLLSVPAAHSNGPRPQSTSPRILLTILVIIGLVFVINGVILPSMISRTPVGDLAELVPAAALPGASRTAARVAAMVSTLVALGAFVLALRQRNVWNGAAVLVVGATLAFVTLAMNPWLWMPLDRYPVAITWALGVWPLASAAWVVLRAVARRRSASVG
jgi:apolipoprotein N-acyltransferase